jgi:hypothetical protein
MISSEGALTNVRRHGVYLALVLGVWFLAMLAGGFAGWFQAGPGEPPLGVPLALVVPLGVFALAYRSSRRLRALALSVDLRLITALQSWRVIGGMFLVLYIFGLLPGLFAYPAAIGDLAVGVAAPFVAGHVARASQGWQRRLLWFNVFGLLDFAVAVATGVLTSPSALGIFAGPHATQYANLGALPLSLVPTFLVPAYIILHAVALLQLAHRAEPARLGASPARRVVPAL